MNGLYGASINKGRGRAGRFFDAFNRWFARTTLRYQSRVGAILHRPLRFLVIFLLLALLAYALYTRLPGSFLPAEDQGAVITVVQAPPGATEQRTDQAIQQVVRFYRAQPQTRSITFVRGLSFFGQGQSNAMSFIRLQTWDERPGKSNNALTLVDKANATVADAASPGLQRSTRLRSLAGGALISPAASLACLARCRVGARRVETACQTENPRRRSLPAVWRPEER